MTAEDPYCDWSAADDAASLRWPGGVPVAVVVVVSLEHFAWHPAAGTVTPPSTGGRKTTGSPYPGILDLHTISQYEYGNRVGAFRVSDALTASGIRPTVAMDAAVIRRAPFLVRHFLEREAEFIGHGVSSEQAMSEAMPEATQRAVIVEAAEAIEEATGRPPRGWVGFDYLESTRTLALLAEAGYDYVVDWPTGDLPHAMTVPVGTMTSLPPTIELDDVVTHVGRGVDVERFARMMTEQVDRLVEEGASSARLCVVNVHPWVTGHPFRIKHLHEGARRRPSNRPLAGIPSP